MWTTVIAIVGAVAAAGGAIVGGVFVSNAVMSGQEEADEAQQALLDEYGGQT